MVYLTNTDPDVAYSSVPYEKGFALLVYLEQLLGALRRGGLVETVRGTNGGYTLSRKPDEITVGDIIRTAEDIDTATGG